MAADLPPAPAPVTGSDADPGQEVRGVADLLRVAAGGRPDEVAMVEAGTGRSLTWAELDDQVSRVASGLAALGVIAGYRVLLAMGNRLELVTSYLGVLRAQAVAVPVNPHATTGELARMLADSGARLVIADPQTLHGVREAVGLVEQDQAPPRVMVVDAAPDQDEVPFERLLEVAGREVPPLADPERLAALLYTSGTSGQPRAAMLTHRALLANLDQADRVEPAMISGDDVVLGVLPLFHVYGLNAVLGGVLRRGARLVLVERFDPEGTLAVIAEHGCTVLPVAPPVFARWAEVADLAERLSTVRLVLSGSAPLDPGLVDGFTGRTGIPVHQGYGLTEAAPVVTSTLCSAELQRGSVGAALPGVRLRLVDDAGRAPEGEDPGEVQVAGDNLFSGYWPDGADGPGPDGWWSTGDVGFLDDAGDLFLVDRLRELVIVSGFNVYPVEVEDVICEVDGVVAAAVIGVEDVTTGEAVVAYVRAPGRDAERVVADVRARCEQRLARFKRPVRVEVVDRLPMTVTGKVRKGRLRQLERRRATGLLQ